MAHEPSALQSPEFGATLTLAATTTVKAALARLHEALDLHRPSPNPETLAELRTAAGALAQCVAALPRQNRENETIRPVLEAARELWRTDFVSQEPTAANVQSATLDLQLGWPGVVAGMLRTPCWAWNDSPRLEKVPDWLWGDYMNWVLTPPLAAAPGVADAYVSRATEYIGELAGWMERNRGSEAVRAAGNAFLDHASSPLLLQATQDLRSYAIARGRLITAIAHTRSGDIKPLAMPRTGRALRVGVLARDFGDNTESRTLLPILQNLDPDRVEIVLFATRHADGTIADAHRHAALEFHVLPEERSAQLTLIAQSACDVLLYASDIAGVTDSFTGLALQRLAPIQAVLPASHFTTGIPAMDLRIVGEATAEPSTERLALLPGSGLAYSDAPAALISKGNPPIRAEFGLPDEGTVFVSAARAELLGTDAMGAWARLLKAVPGSTLVIVQPESADPFLAESLPLRAKQLAGIDPSRVIVTFDDSWRALRLGDFYLDSFPTSDPEALARAVHIGIPPIAWSGSTHRSRTGAAFLRELGAGALVGDDEASYLAIARRLVDEESHRAEMRELIASSPGGCDLLAVADGLTGLLERAHDGLLDSGSRRKQHTPLLLGLTREEVESVRKQALVALDAGQATDALAATRIWLQGEPSCAEARMTHARALRLAGQPARALTYALAALNGRENDATMWLEVAESLRANNRADDALSAYEATLRLDATRVEAWIAISELAAAAGQHEFATEALNAARELCPSDPRLMALAETA